MSKISPEHIRNFNEEGYMIVPDYFGAEQLELMRDECANGIEDMHRRMETAGTNVIHLNHRGSRYFINHQTDRSPALQELAFSPQMAELCRATIGEDAFLFLDQFVVKCSETGMSFSWHQDSGYITHVKVKPYLTCWIPLDDCSIDNGTIYILPYSRIGHRDVTEHVLDPGSNDLVGYSGDDPGIAVEVNAGTLVAFSSHLLHRSAANTTDRMRRVFLLQYSPEAIHGPDGAPLNKVEPFLRGGEYVGESRR